MISMIYLALKQLISWWNLQKKSNWKDDSASRKKAKIFPFDCERVATSSNEVNYVNTKIDVNFIHRTSVKDSWTNLSFSDNGKE